MLVRIENATMKADLDREARLRTSLQADGVPRRGPGETAFHETWRESLATATPERSRQAHHAIDELLFTRFVQRPAWRWRRDPKQSDERTTAV
jgi:hypothetical protein